MLAAETAADEERAVKCAGECAVEFVEAVVERQGVGVRARQILRRNATDQIAGSFGSDGVGRGRDGLPGRERDKTAGAIGAHAYFQPAVRARELVPEIQRDCEQPVAHGRGGVGKSRALLRTARGRVEEREGEVVDAVGRTGAVVQTTLISESGTLCQ